MTTRCSVPRRSRGCHGFTLVEILIVLAILGILAAILLPAFSRVRDTARTATCSSNLRQLSLAFQLYLGDNNRCYMNPSQAISLNPNCDWPIFVGKYVRSPHVFECPSNQLGLYRSGCPAPEKVDEDSVQMHEWSGGYSMADLRGPARYLRVVSVSESRVRNPSQSALLVDAGLDTNGSMIGFCDGPDCLTKPRTPEFWEHTGLAGHPPHSDRKNVLFMDGHVKALTQPQILQPSLWAF